MHREQTRIPARTPLRGTFFAAPPAPPAVTANAPTVSRIPGVPHRATARTAALLAVLLVGAVLLGQANPALAHRVNIFAWVEGGAIRCESSFSSGNPARDAKVTATLAGGATVMGTAVTDAKGRCALPITPELRAAKGDLIIEVQAGEGHRNTWTMPAEEYLAAPVGTVASASPAAPAPVPAPTQAATDTPAAQDAPQAAAPASTAGGAYSGTAPDEAALRRIVAEAVAEQVAPLRHSLAAMQSGGPRMADVAGGIGYIVGLAGIALWARSRRR